MTEDAAQFIKEYNELCKKYNLAMCASMQLRPREENDELSLSPAKVVEPPVKSTPSDLPITPAQHE